MRERSHLRSRAWSALFLTAMTAGCGGGGGSSGGGGFSVHPQSLTFVRAWGAAVPAGQAITMEVTNHDAAYVGAEWPDGEPGWLSLGSIRDANGSYSITVAIADTGLSPGTYSTRLRVGIARSDGSILATQDIPVTYTVQPALRVTEALVAWTWVEGAAPPAASVLHLDGPGLHWTASADQPWIHLGASSGATPGTLSVSADAASLTRGSHHGTLTLTPDAGASAVQLPVDITIQAPQLLASATSLQFSGTNGAALATQQVTLHVSNDQSEAWTASSSAPWLVLDRASGVTPDTITVGVDPSAGPLASGAYSATLTVTSTYGGEALVSTVDVQLSLVPAVLTVSAPSLSLGGTAGRDLSARELHVSLDTGTGAYPFSVAASAPWIAASPTSGLASGAPQTVSVAPDRSGLVDGQYTGQLTVSAQVNGDVLSRVVPVTFVLDRHLLLASDQGVAFASMPGLSALTRTLAVRDNFGGTTAWTATSSQPWLTVTASGTTPGSIVLTADPAGLPADALQLARVTLHADDTTVAQDETVQVGLWIGSTTPATVITAPAAAYQAVAADPVRPYAYLHAGGTNVTAFNVHTGAVVRTYASVAAHLGELAVSADGATLYAHDLTNLTVVPLDLASGTVGTAWPVGGLTDGHLAYSRANGTGLVHLGRACAFEAGTGHPVLSSSCRGIPAVSGDGTRLCWLATGYTPADAWCAPFDYGSVGGGTALVGTAAHATLSGSNFQVSLNADGSRAYIANGGPYRTFDAATMSGLQALPWAPVDVATDGRVLTVRWDTQDLVVYGADGTELGTCAVGTTYYDMPFRRAVFSGDGLRAVVAFPSSNLLRMATAKW